MSEKTEAPWQKLFDEYHRVIRGAGEILRDADRLMAQQGFGSAHKENTVGTESSVRMDKTEAWVTGWFARFYKAAAKPSLVPYVATFLHDRGGTDDFPGKGLRLRAPLVVAGVIRSATECPCVWAYWDAKWWFWGEGGVPDGDIVATSFDVGERENQAGNVSFAVSLERIRSLTDLEQHVIGPLVKLLG